jgi:hypothetical protein
MRGLWRTLAYMAENANGFSDQLDAISGFATKPLKDNLMVSDQPGENRSFSLSRQPTPAILQAIDDFLRSKDPELRLSWYELAEVNRISYEGKTQTPHHKDLKSYWAGLGPVAPANRNDPGFMEAVGALVIDQWTREQMRGGASLTRWFKLTDEQSQGLRRALADNSPAEIAAVNYFAFSWPTPVCFSVVTADINWFHVNK